MDDLHGRLVRCFRAVFPRYSGDVELLRPSSAGDWDSIASVTLLTLIQEEFKVEIGPEDLEYLSSFKSAEKFLRGRIEDAGGLLDRR